MYNKEMTEFLAQTGVEELPEKWQKAIKRVYGSYTKENLPMGLCDPVYICNTMALELGLGDGQGAFFKVHIPSVAIEKTAEGYCITLKGEGDITLKHYPKDKLYDARRYAVTLSGILDCGWTKEY